MKKRFKIVITIAFVIVASLNFIEIITGFKLEAHFFYRFTMDMILIYLYISHLRK